MNRLLVLPILCIDSEARRFALDPQRAIAIAKQQTKISRAALTEILLGHDPIKCKIQVLGIIISSVLVSEYALSNRVHLITREYNYGTKFKLLTS